MKFLLTFVAVALAACVPAQAQSITVVSPVTLGAESIVDGETLVLDRQSADFTASQPFSFGNATTDVSAYFLTPLMDDSTGSFRWGIALNSNGEYIDVLMSSEGDDLILGDYGLALEGNYTGDGISGIDFGDAPWFQSFQVPEPASLTVALPCLALLSRRR